MITDVTGVLLAGGKSRRMGEDKRFILVGRRTLFERSCAVLCELFEQVCVVIAQDRIPEAYWLPQPPKLDRQAILGELKRGLDIPGAQMSNPKPVLSVRTR